MLEIERLIWNQININHIAKHGVSLQEVEAVCHTDVLIFKSYGQRLLLIGIAKNERVLTVILEEIDPKTYFPVTARPASRKERQLYQQFKGGARNEY